MALAELYAAPGITLALTGKDQDKLDEITKTCETAGAHVISEEIDIADYDAISTWVLDVDKDFPIDLVIANAGVTSSIGKDSSPETWEQMKPVFDINLHGTLGTFTPLVEPMRKRQRGQIAIVSSLAAYRGLPVTPAYCASKAATKVYGEALRGVLSADGIGVSVICPGFVETAMSDKFHRPKPFMTTPKKAAKIIRNGLKANRARISFPFPLNLGVWFLSISPAPIAERLIDIFKYGRN